MCEFGGEGAALACVYEEYVIGIKNDEDTRIAKYFWSASAENVRFTTGHTKSIQTSANCRRRQS